MPEYTVTRSNRKTISIRIVPPGKVEVRCPKHMSDKDVHAFVQSKSRWIHSHLEKYQAIAGLPDFSHEELKALANRAAAVIPPRVAYYSRLMGVTCGRITIRAQHSRWGSCTGKGNLNFNCLLMLAPAEVVDYVVVHELCHRKEMNHSPRFWAEVRKVLPNYTASKQWLKTEGALLIARLPK